MSCPVSCGTSRQKIPGQPGAPRARSAKRDDDAEIVEEVREETVYETLQPRASSQERAKILEEDLKRVHQARRKLITDIYSRLTVANI